MDLRTIIGQAQLIKAIGILLFILGYTIGFGGGMGMAVSVLLNRKFSHWVSMVVAPHKSAEPFIWTGLAIAVSGAAILFREIGLAGIPLLQAFILMLLVLNNLFLRLLAVPRFAGEIKIVPSLSWQVLIIVSVSTSVFCWSSELALMAVWSASGNL